MIERTRDRDRERRFRKRQEREAAGEGPAFKGRDPQGEVDLDYREEIAKVECGERPIPADVVESSRRLGFDTWRMKRFKEKAVALMGSQDREEYGYLERYVDRRMEEVGTGQREKPAGWDGMSRGQRKEQ